MPRFSKIQNSFLKGEITPKLFGRTDLEQYNQSCEELLNMKTQKQGGTERRPGSQYLTATNGGIGSSVEARIIPFVIDENEKYVVELTNNDIRVINVSTLTVYDTWPSWASTIFLNTLHQYLIAPSFYTTAEIHEVQYAQLSDTLYLVHENHPPLRIIRTGLNSFVRKPWWGTDTAGENGQNDFPYRNENTQTASTMSLSGTSGVVTITWSGLTSDSGFEGFDSGMEGTPLKFTNVSEGAVVITNVTGVTTATGVVLVSPGAASATSDWAECAWSDYRGWPSVISVHNSRMYFGSNTSQRDTIWATQEFDYRELASPTIGGTLSNDKAFDYTPAASESKVQWISGSKTLFQGTLGEEYIIEGSDPSVSIGATNISLSKETTYGSAFIQPIRLSSTVLFVARDGRTIRELSFNFNEDNYSGLNLSLSADHLFEKFQELIGTFDKGIIRGIAFQESEQILWVVDTNGGLYGLTRDRDTGMISWHRHYFGGSLTSGTYPKAISICCIPSPNNTHDELYVVVKRTINSNDEYYIEKLGPSFNKSALTNTSTDIDDKPVFTDSAKLVRLGSPGTTFTGFSHLEGQSVTVLADGSDVGDFTVSSGNIVINDNATEIVAGLKYRSTIKPVRPEAGAAEGSSQGITKRIYQTIIRFWRTVSASVGNTESDAKEISFQQPGFLMDTPVAPYTGDIEEDFDGDYENEGQILITTDRPYPMGVLSIVYKGETND